MERDRGDIVSKEVPGRGDRKWRLDSDHKPPIKGDMRSRVTKESTERGEQTKRMQRMKVTLPSVSSLKGDSDV